MIFRSQLSAQETSGSAKGAFETIAGVQKNAALEDWYVTQPDHARVSGELAAAFDSRKVPNVTPAVQQAIALHDIGWLPYDGELKSPKQPTPVPAGTPLSFANTEPELFLRAWMGSIQAAQSTGPLGGLIVSAQERLSSAKPSSSSCTAKPHGWTVFCRRQGFRWRRSRR